MNSLYNTLNGSIFTSKSPTSLSRAYRFDWVSQSTLVRFYNFRLILHKECFYFNENASCLVGEKIKRFQRVFPSKAYQGIRQTMSVLTSWRMIIFMFLRHWSLFSLFFPPTTASIFLPPVPYFPRHTRGLFEIQMNLVIFFVFAICLMPRVPSPCLQ